MKKWPGGLILAAALLFFLSGCSEPSAGLFGSGTVLDYIEENYELVDVIKSSADAGDVSKVYSAGNRTLDEVRENIASAWQPEEISEKKDGRQVLVYDQHFVILSNDDEKNGGTLIEVADQGFVRDNFQPDFFDGMLALWILDEVFDVDDWGKKQRARCTGSPYDCYRGYPTTGKAYKGPSSTLPDFRGSKTRGGGPGAGK